MSGSGNRMRGKAAERDVAKRLGGKRIGIMGGEDVTTNDWSIEVKSRQSCVVCNWMNQCIRNCPDGKTPMVVLHIHGKRHDQDLVVLRMRDYLDWYGNPGGIGHEGDEDTEVSTG